MNRIKEINIKNCTYYLFDDMKNIKNFDPIRIRIDKKSNKNIITNQIGYIAIKNVGYVKINRVNSLYFIIDKVDEYIEERNGNKYLTLVSTDKYKDKLKRIQNYE